MKFSFKHIGLLLFGFGWGVEDCARPTCFNFACSRLIMNHDYDRNPLPRITDVEREAPVSSPVNDHRKGSMGVLLAKRRDLVNLAH